MSGKKYYCLVAGLREYALDADNKGFDAREIIEEVREALTERDRATVELLYTYYDIGNLLAAREGRGRFDALGNLTREQIEQESERPALLPAPLRRVLAAYADPDGEDAERVDTSRPLHVALYEAYYRACEESRSEYLRAWSRFDRTLRNVAAAYAAREKGLAIEEALVGHDEVTEALSRSSAADFGLRGELEWIETVAALVGEQGDLLDKEHKLDAIRWHKADELATFDYFDLDAVLSYLTRINMVQRWMTLDEKRGREMYRSLLEGLSGKQFLDRPQAE